MGRLRTVEGEEMVHERLFASGADLGIGRVAVFTGDNKGSDYRAFLARELASANELSPVTKAMVAADSQEDRVFVTLCAPNEFVWLNQTPTEVTRNGLTVPPYGIASQPAPSS
jgi:hypothetical protein